MPKPARLIVIGFILLLLGVILPFLMLIGLVETNLPLNIVAVVCSVAGLATGFMGLATYMRRDR